MVIENDYQLLNLGSGILLERGNVKEHIKIVRYVF